MTDMKKNKALKTVQNYPWLSSTYAVFLVGYLISLNLKTAYPNISPPLDDFLAAYSFMNSPQLLLSMCAIFILLLLLDVQSFRRKRQETKANAHKLRKEIEDLWESKKHLNNKAHTYSGHADKLKLFISDKLLEYIEYDEKFLHFKSIAAEVRHNGVISYDIVSSLLQKLIAQQQSLEQSMAKEEATSSHILTPQQVIEAQQGLDSMRYLWDLLDLSTADNIALHIANQLINAEEHYYQMMLEKDELDKSSLENAAQIIKADFSSLLALHSTLQHLVHEPLTLTKLPLLKHSLKKPPLNKSGEAVNVRDAVDWQFDDEQFTVDVTTQQALLGNGNHIRLVLENLLKNAQHFSRKVPFKQKSDRIVLSLSDANESGVVDFQIYNRGPQIAEDNRKKLFQLGYSTRKTKEHHGKGLGLFFVNEIVKGYEGLLTLDNIDNQADSYSVRIAFKNGTVATNIVNVQIIDQQAVIVADPLSRDEKSADSPVQAGSEKVSSQRWQYAEAIESVEVSSNAMQKTCHFSSDDGYYKQSEHYLQSHQLLAHKLMPPCWSLDIQAKRGGNKTHNVIFNVLDISGVRFSIKLPTAQARLEGIEPSWSDV